MDFNHMQGYRQSHPQDPQNMPPPNLNAQGLPRDAGMNGNHIFQNSHQMPPRMPPGYPPSMTDSQNMPMMSSQDPGMPMGYQPQNHLPGLPPGYPIGGQMSSRPPQRFPPQRQNETGAPPQSFNPQQQPPPSHQAPPPHSMSQRGPFPGHSQGQADFHPHVSHSRPPGPNPSANDFHPGGHGGPPDFHPGHQQLPPAPEFHPTMHHNVAEFHPRQRSNNDMSALQHGDRMTHHDFRHSNRNDPHHNMMGSGGYIDHNGIGGMPGMMSGHGMMGPIDNHIMGGGDGYGQHDMMNMYDPSIRECPYLPMGYQLMDKAMQSSITCVNFDTQQELLWCGNQRGYIASYHGADFQKYTACRVSMDEDVRMNLSFPQGVLSLTQGMLKGTLRRGLHVFNFRDSHHMHDMQCMMMRGDESVLIGGHHKHVLEVDIIRNCCSAVYEVKDPGVAIFRHTDRFVCGGDSTGKVTVYDKKTMRPEHTLDAHSSCLSDFDIQDNLLITCGFSNRLNTLTPDRLLRVYDMRVMRAMNPIQVTLDPTFLRFTPSIPNSLVVVSQMGSFEIVATITGGTPTSPQVYPITTGGSAVIAFDVSSTFQAMAFGDSSGHVQLFATEPGAAFNQFSEPCEMPDPVEQLAAMDISDELAAYSSIPMAYPPEGHLLSDFPEHMMQQVYRKPQPIDPEILRQMKVYQNVGYAPNYNKQKRNVIPYDLNDAGHKNAGNSTVPESPIGRGDDPLAVVPKRYRPVEIKYSKFGVEDFDFRHYNKTNLAGLEPHIPNAYCNSMLQVLYYLEPLRCSLLGHVCAKEFCLSCELGFLFHMLDSQKGSATQSGPPQALVYQATNFLRAFRTMPQVSALGLVLHDIDENRVDFPRLIQSWQRFVLMQIHEETCVPVEDNGTKEEQKSKSESKGKENKKIEVNGTADPFSKGKGEPEFNSDKIGESEEEKQEEPVPMTRSIIRDLFGVQFKIRLQCKCGLEHQRLVDHTHVNLSYPDFKPAGSNAEPLFVSFAEVVQNSMSPSSNIQTWCSKCNRYQHHNQKKQIQNLPDVLALNCHTENEKNLDFWKAQFKIVRERFADTTPQMAVHPPTSNTKKCRFGMSCHRPDCMFAHDGPRDCETQQKRKPKEAKEDDEFGPSWIPMGLKTVRNPNGTVDVTEISDEEPLPDSIPDNVRYYELYSVVSNVLTNQGSNLVCCLKVGELYHKRKEKVSCTQWYLLNDFCVTPVEKDEAVDFKLDWNVPCIIHYTRRNLQAMHDLDVKPWSSPDIIYSDPHLLNPQRRQLTFTPLTPEELPGRGDLVALDAEFVSLKEEEQTLRSDGTSSTSLPAQMSVARITCIRGSGPNEGEPFIDDYINTSEQVVDYLTQFSGIKGGDLDPATSTKHLTTLKATYLKLRYLVDHGVVFIGHGLKKDFRVINLLVPKAQVLDTVDLYHLPRQRYISLKFLAWYFLKTTIQSFTHDSVEDARTALFLYKHYQAMQGGDSNKVRATITELYEYGRNINWKIPEVKLQEEENEDDLGSFL